MNPLETKSPPGTKSPPEKKSSSFSRTGLISVGVVVLCLLVLFLVPTLGYVFDSEDRNFDYHFNEWLDSMATVTRGPRPWL